MPRHPRQDEPGSWHHVFQRGIAKRTLFEGALDIRYFLACLARAVRAGLIEVHAFCVLVTHFHLLLRSPVGRLSDAMQRIQNRYVRMFNRRRKRDGTLVRGRFRSKPVKTERYREVLVRYIDRNPVKAGIVVDPTAYPFGSARCYAVASGPPWLERSWVERFVREAVGSPEYDTARYADVFPVADGAHLEGLVARRITYAGNEDDPLDNLYGAAPASIRAWMHRKAGLADQTKPGIPVVGAASVVRCVRRAAALSGTWNIKWGRKGRAGWAVAEAVLLRDLAGATYAEITRLCGGSPHFWRKTYEQHAPKLESDSDYAARLFALTQRILSDCLGTRARGPNQ
jgi:REP element-mobilizing transposase RayT